MDPNKYVTVSALTKYLKYKFETDSNLQDVYLKAEISNFKAHPRGHFYFTLKDETSRINAVMFNFKAGTLKFLPTDGMKVLVHGKINVYEATGNYQIYVDEILEDGVGNLYLAFEQLKQKLEKEGLFDQKYKQVIPKIPMKIGIITSDTGAAIRDILTTLKRRFPIAQTILFPALVQGELAKNDLVKKISLADSYNLDVIILGRGGGSIEDLWPFNEEDVARAIFKAKTPIISGVGHEVDFTISDFVADLRAATPTAAATLAVPDYQELLLSIASLETRSNQFIKHTLINYNNKIDKIKNSYVILNPLKIYDLKLEKIKNYEKNILSLWQSYVEKKWQKINNIKQKNIILNPVVIYDKYSNYLNIYKEKLSVLDPESALKRGYAILRKNDALIKFNNIKLDDEISIKMQGGLILSKVFAIKEEKNGKK